MNGHHHSAAETFDLAQARAERLGETIRLAMRIADMHARSTIELHCATQPAGAPNPFTFTWYDTRAFDRAGDPELEAAISDALRYLQLRGAAIAHPVQAHLVRFHRTHPSTPAPEAA